MKMVAAKMKKYLLCLIILIATFPSHGGYTANFSGKITQVLTYPGSTLILIRVENTPRSHPKCSLIDYMAIDPNISADSRQLIMSRILLAYSTKEVINIGYDKNSNADSCIGNRLRVYRVG